MKVCGICILQTCRNFHRKSALLHYFFLDGRGKVCYAEKKNSATKLLTKDRNVHQDTTLAVGNANMTHEKHPLVDLINSKFASSEHASVELTEVSQSAELDLQLANMVKIAEIQQRTQIDLTKIHCSKTGQPIATRDPIQLERLLRMYGVDNLEKLAPYIDMATNVADIWLFTGPDNLNRLQALDPRGFFCFCIGLALQNHHMTYINERKQFYNIEARRRFHNSLVKAWYLTSQFDEAELIEANKHLRFFMFLDLHNTRYYKLPWHQMRNTEGQYDPGKDALLPEEFATRKGVDWIKTQLDNFLRVIHRRKEHNNIAYAHLHTASAFRAGKKFIGDLAELEYIMDVVGPIKGEDRMSLRELVARSKRIMKQETKSNVHIPNGPITLNIIKAKDGSIDIAKEQPATTLPQQEKKPIGIIKLSFNLAKKDK